MARKCVVGVVGCLEGWRACGFGHRDALKRVSRFKWFLIDRDPNPHFIDPPPPSQKPHCLLGTQFTAVFNLGKHDLHSIANI
jgi:hypothetical protein